MSDIVTYRGHSISEEALTAYSAGAKPLSKWTKPEIILALSVRDVPEEWIHRLSKLPVAVLREKLLQKTGSYYTSCWFRLTDFYKVTEPDEQTVIDCEALACAKQNAQNTEIVNGIATYPVWTGTRRNPEHEDYNVKGFIRGQWFYGEDGARKSIYGKGFRFKKEDKHVLRG